MLRKIVSFVIILPLLIVPLLCCCNQTAMAATVEVEHCHDDEDSPSTTRHDESGSDHDDACNCGHALNAVLENLTTSQVTFLFGHNYFPEITSIEPISVVLLKGSIYPAYLGPPGRSSEVPLYIHQHSLRI